MPQAVNLFEEEYARFNIFSNEWFQNKDLLHLQSHCNTFLEILEINFCLENILQKTTFKLWL